MSLSKWRNGTLGGFDRAAGGVLRLCLGVFSARSQGGCHPRRRPADRASGLSVRLDHAGELIQPRNVALEVLSGDTQRLDQSAPSALPVPPGFPELSLAAPDCGRSHPGVYRRNLGLLYLYPLVPLVGHFLWIAGILLILAGEVFGWEKVADSAAG